MATGDAIMVGFDRRIAASLSPDDVFAHHDGDRLAIIRWAASADRAVGLRPAPGEPGLRGARSRSRAVATPPS